MWFSDFIEVFDFTDSFTIQSQTDYNTILDKISLCVGPFNDLGWGIARTCMHLSLVGTGLGI